MIEKIIEWIGQNYEWIFGGIGVLGLTVFAGLFRNKKSLHIDQRQKTGNFSSNIQVGNINKSKDGQ